MEFFWWLPFGRVPEIEAQELHARMQNGSALQILDVRTGLEWNNSRIAGAINVPVTELKARLEFLALDKQRPVIAVCRSAHRSVPAVRLLRAHGFDVCQLRKGMQAWWRAELPTEGAGNASTDFQADGLSGMACDRKTAVGPVPERQAIKKRTGT